MNESMQTPKPKICGKKIPGLALTKSEKKVDYQEKREITSTKTGRN